MPTNLLRGECSEGRTPQALPARKMAGSSGEGGTRREGKETLRTEGGGQATPVSTGPCRKKVSSGTKAREGAGAERIRLVRIAQDPGGRRNSTRGGKTELSRFVLRETGWKDRKAESKDNGEVGALNRYGRYRPEEAL
jgi:hypothetical protein